jgi:hypothetical protein
LAVTCRISSFVRAKQSSLRALDDGNRTFSGFWMPGLIIVH